LGEPGSPVTQAWLNLKTRPIQNRRWGNRESSRISANPEFGFSADRLQGGRLPDQRTAHQRSRSSLALSAVVNNGLT
jgi:hypothetical protein